MSGRAYRCVYAAEARRRLLDAWSVPTGLGYRHSLTVSLCWPLLLFPGCSSLPVHPPAASSELTPHPSALALLPFFLPLPAYTAC